VAQVYDNLGIFTGRPLFDTIVTGLGYQYVVCYRQACLLFLEFISFSLESIRLTLDVIRFNPQPDRDTHRHNRDAESDNCGYICGLVAIQIHKPCTASELAAGAVTCGLAG
jgi:hypothetical protein